MCQSSFYELFLQGVGLVTLSILIVALILIISDLVSIDFVVTDEKNGKKNEQ